MKIDPNLLATFLKSGEWKGIKAGQLIDENLANMPKHFYQTDETDSYAIFYDNDFLEISVFKNEIQYLLLRDPRFHLGNLTILTLWRFCAYFQVKLDFYIRPETVEQYTELRTEGNVHFIFEWLGQEGRYKLEKVIADTPLSATLCEQPNTSND